MGQVYASGQMQDKSYMEMQLKYMKYVITHKTNVEKAYRILFIEKSYNDLPEGITRDMWNTAIAQVGNRIKDHDNSKFSVDEFEPYRRHFNPTPEEEKITDPDIIKEADDAYEKAWKHHYLNNSHHPEYWAWHDIGGNLLSERLQESTIMSLDAIIEMFCDWYSMDLYHNNPNPIKWYNSKDSEDERKAFNSKTKKLVEELIYMIHGVKPDPSIASE